MSEMPGHNASNKTGVELLLDNGKQIILLAD